MIATPCWTPATGPARSGWSPVQTVNRETSASRLWTTSGEELLGAFSLRGELLLFIFTDLISLKYWDSFRDQTTSNTRLPVCNVHKSDCRDVRDTPSGDVVDAGVFQRSDLRSELRKMNRGEVEGRLGLSTHKVDAILNRAEIRTNQMYRNLVRKKGDIHYNAFLGKYMNRLT